MLWDLIRDFFVMHVFGGTLSNGGEILVNTGRVVQGEESINNFTDVYYNISIDGEGLKYDISASDWLSTTATAISITIIVVLCCLFIYKIIKLIGGLIR